MTISDAGAGAGEERRFTFGKNWSAFLAHLSEERILQAEESLQDLLGVRELTGKRFVDVGSGSGLSSLAARRLQAVVHSFDYDPTSVACTQELKSRFFREDEKWAVEQGSALDESYLDSLGKFDIVYTWGVLHHTGDMWKAIENVTKLVDHQGTLVIAIYNDQGRRSRYWWRIKRVHCAGVLGRIVVLAIFLPYYFLRYCLASIVKRRNLFSDYKKRRGMSVLHDWFDWLGGFPFEVARAEEIFRFVKAKGFVLGDLVTTRSGYGNNQFVFIKE